MFASVKDEHDDPVGGVDGALACVRDGCADVGGLRRGGGRFRVRPAFGAACFGAAPAAWNISSAAAAIGITFMNASSGWLSLTYPPVLRFSREEIQL